MNENNILTLDNLEILVSDTKGGKMIVSTQHDNKHYRGWVNERTINGNNGNTWIRKIANLILCDYKDCKICDGAGNVVEKPWMTKQGSNESN